MKDSTDKKGTKLQIPKKQKRPNLVCVSRESGHESLIKEIIELKW